MRRTLSERLRRDAARRALWQGIAAGVALGAALAFVAWWTL